MMIKRVQFPEYTNAQINAALLADKVNEVIEFLNAKHPEPNTFLDSGKISDADDARGTVVLGDNGLVRLKPGVRITKNGKHYLQGKGFIKKEEAYL